MSAGAGGAASRDASVPALRTLIITLPGGTWEAVNAGDAPAIARLTDAGLNANFSMRTYRSAPLVGDAAATFGAGIRATSKGSGGNALEAGEVFEQQPAKVVYERFFGSSAGDAAVLNLDAPQIIRANAAAVYKADVGALGTELRAHGVRAGVVANADGTTESKVFGREATLALMDNQGRVPCGAVGRSLLQADPTAPFGVRYDQQQVVDAANECIGKAGTTSVTLVDAGDLQRTYAYAEISTEDGYEKLLSKAWKDTDALVEALVETSKPDRIILLGWTPGEEERSLGMISLSGKGITPGVAVSGTTRQDGFVTATDLAPTILEWYGLTPDREMDGRPIERAGASINRDEFIDANQRALWFADTQVPFQYVLVAWMAAICAGALLCRRFPTFVSYVHVMSLGLLLVIPLTYLGMEFSLHSAGTVGSLLLLISFALAGAWLLYRLVPKISLPISLGFLLAIPMLSVTLFGSRWQVSSLFGNSPITGGRFSGSNNTTFAMVICAVIGLACIWRSKRGAAADIGIAGAFAAVSIIQGAPMWGSDVGSIIAGIPILVIAWFVITGRRLRMTWLLGMVGATSLAIAAAIAVDLQRPVADRTHLGRLWEKATSEGFDGFWTVIARKWQLNVQAFAFGPYWYIAGIGVIAAVAWYWAVIRHALEERSHIFGARYLVAILVAAVIGTVLNDSGIAVGAALGLVLIGTLGTLRPELVRPSYTGSLHISKETHV